VLRAGLGLSDGMLDILEYAEVGHIGVARDHVTHMPTEYLIKLPENLAEKQVYLIDPMLATGNSAIHAASVLLQHGAKPENIKLVTLVSAPEGVKKFHAKYPEIPVISCALDKKLNENAYIVPGLGDAGDRIFGTK
jgi:uracil phosphoribosyltransferase